MTPAYSEGFGFVEVVQRHGGPLLRLARRLVGSTADAEEIVQEALLRAYADRFRRARSSAQHASQDHKGRELTACVYKITHNLSVDYLRRRRLRLLDRDAIARRPDARAPTAEQAFEIEALRAAVRDAVGGLPENYRDVVSLRFGLGLTYRAISRQLGVSVSAVEARLHRAKARLRKALAPWAGPGRGRRAATSTTETRRHRGRL